MKTLITWINGSVDGERESKALAKLRSANADIADSGISDTVAPKKFNAATYSSLIVVGHSDELTDKVREGIVAYAKGTGCRYVVLAACDSSRGEYKGALSDQNKLLSPASKFATSSGIKTFGTRRELLFVEVGTGTAFQVAKDGGLKPKDPPGADDLWATCTGDSVEELIEGIKNM